MFILWAFVINCGLTLFSQPGKVTVTGREYVNYKGRDKTRISYDYDDAGGHHADTVLFSESSYGRYPPGATIPMHSISMLGHSTVRFGSVDSWWVLAFLGFLVIAWDGFVVLTFFAICLVPLLDRRLLRRGQPTRGRITEKTMGPPSKSKKVYKLTYEYASQDGERQSDTKDVRDADYHSAETGDEVLVFYNPRMPLFNALYPCCDYALRELER